MGGPEGFHCGWLEVWDCCARSYYHGSCLGEGDGSDHGVAPLEDGKGWLRKRCHSCRCERARLRLSLHRRCSAAALRFVDLWWARACIGTSRISQLQVQKGPRKCSSAW